jgi:hypothetical protein
VEGPYGSPKVDVYGSRCRCFLIISSGVGWTFLRAWKRQLLQDAERGRAVRLINSIAIIKYQDAHFVDEFGGWSYGSAKETLPHNTVATVPFYTRKWSCL